MPKAGFKSITINVVVYKKLHEAFKRDKSNTIPYFSCWLTAHIQRKLDDADKLRKLAREINKVPDYCNGYEV